MDLRNCTKQELSQMPYEYVREAYYQHNPNAVWILGVFFRHGKNGAPYDMKDVYEDFEWVKNRILTLVEIFNRYNKVAINDVWQLSCT